jgi:demethylmenaquinone methyltransferase/2-methoxy-6-polyprenyl-1,4-benzoquinol methylase
VTVEPHPVLAPHYKSPRDKQQFLRGIFDRTAPYYEGITRWGFLGSGDWYRRQALLRAGLRPGMRVLDIAAGTGPTARAAVQVLGNAKSVVCLDLSLEMLRVSRQRLAASYVQGAADNLPVRDDSVDFLTMGFALRHVESLEGAFCEYRRVLKPGGKALILDTIKPRHRTPRLLARLYFHELLPWMTRRLARSDDAGTLVEYYWTSMDQMAPPEAVLDALRTAGFQGVTRRVFFGMFSEYEGTKA